MSNEKKPEGRIWTTPVLRKIEAGSAEAKKGNGIADGGTGGNDKS